MSQLQKHITEGFSLAAQSNGTLEIACISPRIIVLPNVVQQKREQFNQSAKSNFYRELAKHKPEILHQLGFNKDQIKDIEKRGTKAIRRHTNKLFDQYDLDHILSLRLGGSNSHDNLCLTPKFVNKAKSRMEEAQIILFPDLDYTQTIVPTKLKTGKHRSIIPLDSVNKLQAA